MSKDYEVIVQVKLIIEDVSNRSEAMRVARTWEGEMDRWSITDNDIHWNGVSKPVRAKKID